MLMNNLDPEVAEKPRRAGRLRRHRPRGARLGVLRPHRRGAARARGRRDAAGAVGQAGRRVPHPRRRAARADRQLQPRAALGDLGALQRARPQGPDDVRPDDGRLVDLHRQPGHRAGHLRDLRRDRAASTTAATSPGTLDPDRGPRRHGRRAAAGRDDGRRVDARGRVPAEPHRDAPAHRLPRRAGAATSTRRWRSSSARAASKKPVSVGLLGNAAEILPELVRRGVRPDMRDRPDLGARSRSTATCRRAGRSPSGRTGASSDPNGVERGRASSRWPCTCARCSTSTSAACRRSTTATTSARWRKDEGVADAFDFPGFVPAYIRPLFCRGIGPFRWVALSGDPEDIYTHRRQGEGAAARRHAPAPLARHGAASASRSRACRRASAGSGLGERAPRSASPSTRWWRSGELKAPIVIGRDHLDSGSVASPNRETEAMHDGSRRGVRLAAAQRAAQLRLAAPPGCRCTTAAASAWATRSTPAW